MNGQIQVNSGDISIIAVNVDGKPQDTIPTKEDGKYFESADCDNDAQGYWDRTNWEFRIQKLTKKKTKCTLNFVSQDNVEDENSNVASKMETLLKQEEPDGEKLGKVLEDEHGNIRYIGANPPNYVYFNCTEGVPQNSDNCETWRIIGLMNNIQTANNGVQRLLKIIRKDGIGSYNWDDSERSINGGYGVNEWSQADLMYALKKYGGASLDGEKCGDSTCPSWDALKTNAQNMIEEVIWNTGSAPIGTYDKPDIPHLLYEWERSDNNGKLCNSVSEEECSDKVERTTTWQGKIGLMYPSDYGYSTDGGGNTKRLGCLYYTYWGSSYETQCKTNSWLYDSNHTQWTMTPSPSTIYNDRVYSILNSGSISSGSNAGINCYVRPVLYLKSSVKIIGGTGDESSPYQLKLEN